MRHKAMESRMKALCGALLECLVAPLQDKLDDWRKVTAQLDKDHGKEFKKLRAEIKKKKESTARSQKKNSKKGKNAAPIDNAAATAEIQRHFRSMMEAERGAVRKAMVEERSRYCTFVACVKPLVEGEVGLVTELQQMEEVVKKVSRHTEEPFKLPAASEQVITDLAANGGDSKFKFKTPPSSPSSLGSRKSSMCSISSAGSSTSVHQMGASPHHGANATANSQQMAPGGATLRHRSLSQVREDINKLLKGESRINPN